MPQIIRDLENFHFHEETPTTPPNHPGPSLQIPFTPPKDHEKAAFEERLATSIEGFESEVRRAIETFLKDDVQLPSWEPPSGRPEIWSHITGLKLPVISQFPSLLFHNLGQRSHDPRLARRVNKLFPLKPQNR